MTTSRSVIAILYPEPEIATCICDICGYTSTGGFVRECADGIRRCQKCRTVLGKVIYIYGGHRQYMNGDYRHTVRA